MRSSSKPVRHNSALIAQGSMFPDEDRVYRLQKAREWGFYLQSRGEVITHTRSRLFKMVTLNLSMHSSVTPHRDSVRELNNSLAPQGNLVDLNFDLSSGPGQGQGSEDVA